METQALGGHFRRAADLAQFWRYVVITILFFWSVVMGGSLLWNFHLLDEQFANLAYKEAVANFDKDQAFRLWGNKHGGVYVPTTAETPASPYLSHIPERDIETPSGRKLTLMNPAYMVRQLMDDYAELYGVRGRITGLAVLRQGNAPDDWERQALLQLKDGAAEVTANAEIDGEPYHRMMRPVYMKPGCDKCHGQLGFKLGDFRGGVGVSVPLAPYIAARQNGVLMLSSSHGVIWLLGLGGIVFCARQLRSRIDERDRADEQMTAQRTRFETLLDLAPDAFIVMDEERRIRMFSRGASNIFGYAPEEVLGQQIDTMLPGFIEGEVAHQLGNAPDSTVTNSAPDTVSKVSAQRKDGSTFPAEASVAGIELSNEILLTATVRDVTERKKEEEVVRRAQRMDAIGQLTGGIAHDFNNLLAVVLGNLSLLDSKLPVGSELRSLTDPAMRAVQRGASLTQRLLAFAKRQTLHITAIDAGELLASLNEMLRRSLGEDIDFVLDVEPGLWLCEADAGQLEQAVVNLANNARDAMPSGGRLVIKAANHSLSADAAAQVAGAKPGDYVAVSVTDDGTGIAPETLGHIFEPFFTTKETGAGTGLGLSMVYGFVSQSSGHIAVSSECGKGTRVSLYLPRKTGAAAGLWPPHKVPVAAGDGETVFVVDDDSDIREMVGRVVSSLGYNALRAESGEEALQLLHSQGPIELLLTDVILAGSMNGVELAHAVGRVSSDTKILYMSGYASDALARRIDPADEASLIHKPFHPDELAKRLRAAILI